MSESNNNDNIVCKTADKNLGVVAMDRKNYVTGFITAILLKDGSHANVETEKFKRLIN